MKQTTTNLLERTVFHVYKIYCKATFFMRTLPDFLLIGAQKGGSTSFYEYIIQHPNVLQSFKKAPKYFDHNYHRGLAWYRSFFPYKSRKFQNGEEYLVGEASQDTIFHPLAPKRVHQLLPDAKILVFLRNPIDRAYSHYHHRKRIGKEDLSFENAIDAEEIRMGNIEERISNNENVDLYNFLNYSYLARGLYAKQLKRWFDVFPREQFFILSSEDFFASPDLILNQVFAFLGLQNFSLLEYLNKNPGNYEPMSLPTRSKLNKYFEPHNQELYDLLGTDFRW